MLSKEEISEVISYCQEHGCSYKDRLTELGIAEWKFYDSKYRYAIQERKIKESGQWLEDVLRQMPYYERDGKGALSAGILKSKVAGHASESDHDRTTCRQLDTTCTKSETRLRDLQYVLHRVLTIIITMSVIVFFKGIG